MIYYNSRLQTILAHNTLLMIGYSFGDINIHDIYFKFLDQLESNEEDNNSKVSYIVLTDYDRSYFARDKETGETVQRDSKYYNLYVKFLKSKRIEVIEAPNLETFLLKLYEEYRISNRLTKSKAQTLLDKNREVMLKIFEAEDYSEEMDVEALELMIQKPVILEEWISEKADLRRLEIFESKNDLLYRVQKYINELVTADGSSEYINLIGLSARIANLTRSFDEHSKRMEILLRTIEKMDINLYRRKKLSVLDINRLETFTNSFRDIFNFAKKGYGKAWDSNRLLTRKLENNNFNVFELYIWSLESDLKLLRAKLLDESRSCDILDEWYDMRSLLINNSEKEWLDEICHHKFQIEIEELLNENQQLTNEISELLDL